MTGVRVGQICASYKARKKSIEGGVRHLGWQNAVVFAKANKPAEAVFHPVVRQKIAQSRPLGMVLALPACRGADQSGPKVCPQIAPSFRVEAMPGGANGIDKGPHEPHRGRRAPRIDARQLADPNHR